MTQVFYAAVDVKKNPKENPVSMATQLQLETPRPRGAFPCLGLALEPGGALLDRRGAVAPPSPTPSCWGWKTWCLRGTRPQTLSTSGRMERRARCQAERS